MEKYLDYKATIWFRIPINNREALETIQELLNNCQPSDLYNELQVGEDIGPCETVDGTEEFIRAIENDGEATIEIYEGTKLLWDNSFESELNRKQ